MGKNTKENPDNSVFEVTSNDDGFPVIGGRVVERLFGDYEYYERLATDDSFRSWSAEEKPRSPWLKKYYRTIAKSLREEHEAKVAWELEASQYRTDAHYTIARLVREVADLKQRLARLEQ